MTGHALQDSYVYSSAAVTAITKAAEDIAVITVTPAKPFSYQAGQYVFIRFGDLPPRPYSIANAPGSGDLEIHVKKSGGPVSRFVTESLQTGTNVQISPAQGTSILSAGTAGPVLAVAGGLGITPIKAMAEAALRHDPAAPFILYWGTQTAAERYLDDYFVMLDEHHDDFSYRPVTGRSVTGILAGTDENLATSTIYLSGPPAMISATIPVLLDKGARREKISYDRHPEAATLGI